MSETIREVLSDNDLLTAIMNNSEKKPVYWDFLPTKNGVTAIVVAQMLKAMAGDTNAFTALSRYGFGEKVQMEVSDFYRANKIDIEVVKAPSLEEGEVVDPGEIGKQAFDAIADGLDVEIEEEQLEEDINDNSETSSESTERAVELGKKNERPDEN